MRIHAATDNDIFPPRFGATQRTFGLMRGLARRHAVRVLCVVPNRSRGAREERAAGVTLARRRAWYTGLAWRLERARLAPLFTAAYAHAAGARRLLAALPGRPDVLAADLNLAALLDAGAATLRVYTAHNVEADHFRMVKARVAAAGFWAARIRALEARAVARADLTVACTVEDAARLAELYGATPARLHVVPNGFDETRINAPDEESRTRARAALGIAGRDYATLFLGSDTPFNRAALDHLVTRVLPPLAADGFRLIVAGSVVAAMPRREPWLIARPETDDLAPLLHAADAGLNPVTTGGGSNVKVPTYLGAGLAVVTSAFGLRGYDALRPWVTVAEPAAMTAALAERPAGWRARGLARPEAVEAHAWGRLGERLGERLEAMLAARAPAPEAARAEPAPAPAVRAAGRGA